MPPVRKSAFHVSDYRPLRGDIICREDLNMNVLIARLDCYTEGELRIHYGLALGKIIGDDQLHPWPFSLDDMEQLLGTDAERSNGLGARAIRREVDGIIKEYQYDPLHKSYVFVPKKA